MHIKNKTSRVHKILYGIMLLAVFLSTFGGGDLSTVSAQGAAAVKPALTLTTVNVLSTGQFVYGPNVGDFNLKVYLEKNAPHLSKYADDLYQRSEYFSINPKVYLTLLEVHAHLISSPDLLKVENPFGLPNMDFISQTEYLFNKMVDAYYLHLYSYSPLPFSQRNLKPFITPGGVTVNVAPDTNAGTYAIIAGLAAMDEPNISLILDQKQTNGFYQTYMRLFGKDNPLDEKNHIYTPGEVGALAAPDNLLQLPWLQGSSWFFGGVHSNGSGGVVGSPYTDASALDFSPGGISWGGDTSNMWVVASASGIPTKISNCYFSILHSDGWETTYYHIENIQNFSGSINQNDKIGVLANTLAEAICSGGSSTGPHIHFNLKHNGALVAINGTPLSGWYVHAGRWNYDTDPNYMWLEKNGTKKYANINVLLSESTIPTTFVDVPATYWAWNFIESLFNAGVTGGCSITPLMYCPETNVNRAQMAVFLLRGIHGSTYTPPAATGTVFADVPLNNPYAAWIEHLSAEGITSGCGGGNYCPNSTITRAQMAVFLLRAEHTSAYVPPAATGTLFVDVPLSNPYAAWIERLSAEGVTSGCGESNYCLNNSVTRAQMAVFLVRTFGFLLPPFP